MKTKEEIASAWAGIKLEIFTDTKDLKHIHPYITPKQCLRAMEAYKEETVTKLKQGAVMPALLSAGKLALAARLVTTSNAKNISNRIEDMEAALDAYDNEIMSISNEA